MIGAILLNMHIFWKYSCNWERWEIPTFFLCSNSMCQSEAAVVLKFWTRIFCSLNKWRRSIGRILAALLPLWESRIQTLTVIWTLDPCPSLKQQLPTTYNSVAKSHQPTCVALTFATQLLHGHFGVGLCWLTMHHNGTVLFFLLLLFSICRASSK